MRDFTIRAPLWSSSIFTYYKPWQDNNESYLHPTILGPLPKPLCYRSFFKGWHQRQPTLINKSNRVDRRKAREYPPCINVCNICPKEAAKDDCILYWDHSDYYEEREKLRAMWTLVNVFLKEYIREDLLHMFDFDYLWVIWVMVRYLFYVFIWLCVYFIVEWMNLWYSISFNCFSFEILMQG